MFLEEEDIDLATRFIFDLSRWQMVCVVIVLVIITSSSSILLWVVTWSVSIVTIATDSQTLRLMINTFLNMIIIINILFSCSVNILQHFLPDTSLECVCLNERLQPETNSSDQSQLLFKEECDNICKKETSRRA